MPAFLPSIFFNQSRGGGGAPCPSPRSVSSKIMVTSRLKYLQLVKIGQNLNENFF